MKSWKSAFAAVLALGTTATAWANPVYLGSISLTDRPEYDVLRLPACANSWNQRVSSLKLEVRRHGAEVNLLQVQFQNGEVDTLHVREHIQAGGESRWIDLNGGNRCIRFIRVVGDADTDGNTPRQQAQVLFYGR